MSWTLGKSTGNSGRRSDSCTGTEAGRNMNQYEDKRERQSAIHLVRLQRDQWGHFASPVPPTLAQGHSTLNSLKDSISFTYIKKAKPKQNLFCFKIILATLKVWANAFPVLFNSENSILCFLWNNLEEIKKILWTLQWSNDYWNIFLNVSKRYQFNSRKNDMNQNHISNRQRELECYGN